MSTSIKVELAAQAKTVVPKVWIESDELSEEEITKRVTKLFDEMEGIAMAYAKRRM